MATVLPAFLYGLEVTTSNRDLPFDRGGNRDAVLRLGRYLPGNTGGLDEFCKEVARAMNAADTGQNYTCVFDHSTRKFTIDNGATAIALEFSRNASTNCAGLLGFDDADTASSAAGHTSTSAAGAGFSTLTYWTPTDPIHMTTPVSANADGTAASNLQRDVQSIEHVYDGGMSETIYKSTLKEIELHFRWVIATGSPTEIANMESFLNWAQKGYRFNYYPDKTSGNTLRLKMRTAGKIANVHEWVARPEISWPPLRFLEQLTRV